MKGALFVNYEGFVTPRTRWRTCWTSGDLPDSLDDRKVGEIFACEELGRVDTDEGVIVEAEGGCSMFHVQLLLHSPSYHLKERRLSDFGLIIVQFQRHLVSLTLRRLLLLIK